MYSYIALRQVRHLSTAAGPAAISISKVKSKLRSEYDPDKALDIYSHLPETSPTSSRYAQECTVRRLAKSHRFSDIEKFLESHKNDPKIKEESFLSSIIRSYGVAGMFDGALRTYNQMDDLGTPRTTVSFNALLSACVRSKCFDKVPELFDELPKKNMFTPDKVSYGILVKAYCEKGKVETALEMLKEMEEKCVEITTITYSTILHSLYSKGMGEEAERLWDVMLRSGGVDVGAYNVKIHNVHGGDVEAVKGLIEEMNSALVKPDTITYNYLMTCYCKKGMMDEARKVYDDLESNGCKPNSTTFRTLIFHLCKHERYETGYKIFKQSVAVHKIPDFNTLKYLVVGLVKKSKTKEAKGMIRTVKKKFPPNVVKSWEKLQKELGLETVHDEVDTHEGPVGEEEVKSSSNA